MSDAGIAARPTDTQRRDEMMSQVVKLLFLMNGGGSIALLAFLQSIWPPKTGPVQPAIYGLMCLSVGTALAGVVLLIRYSTTSAFQRAWAIENDQEAHKIAFRRAMRWHDWYMRCAYACVGLFVLGTFVVAIGALCALRGLP